MRMKTHFIPVWTPVFAAGILLLMLANPAAASLKRVIVLERPTLAFRHSQRPGNNRD